MTAQQPACRVALAYQAPLEIASGGPDLGEIADGGTALGLLIALGVLAASVGLIRSEAAPDLLPLAAAAGGWLFAGRKPPAVARQPIE